MKTLALDTNGDLKIPLAFLTDADAVAQAILIRLNFFKGEWFLDQDAGMPYFQRIFRDKFPRGTDDVDAIVKNEILNTPNVRKLTAFSSSLVNRVYSATFTCETTFGEVKQSWQV